MIAVETITGTAFAEITSIRNVPRRVCARSLPSQAKPVEGAQR